MKGNHLHDDFSFAEKADVFFSPSDYSHVDSFEEFLIKIIERRIPSLRTVATRHSQTGVEDNIKKILYTRSHVAHRLNK